MTLHCLFAYTAAKRDGFVRQAIDHKSQDESLALGKRRLAVR